MTDADLKGLEALATKMSATPALDPAEVREALALLPVVLAEIVRLKSKLRATQEQLVRLDKAIVEGAAGRPVGDSQAFIVYGNLRVRLRISEIDQRDPRTPGGPVPINVYGESIDSYEVEST